MQTGCLWPSLECVQEEKCVSDEETSMPFCPCDFVPDGSLPMLMSTKNAADG